MTGFESRVGGVAAVALAASVLLTGCAVDRGEVPRPTGSELEVLNQRVRDIQWQVLQFPPNAARPAVEFEEFVDPDRTGEVYTACMVEAGHTGWTPTNVGAFGGPSSAERRDLYVCVSRYPLAPSNYGFYTSAQLDALYNYYRDLLVPCLEASGIAVTAPPSREDFTDAAGFGLQWSPYSFGAGDFTEIELSSLSLGCPDVASSRFGAWE